MLMLLLQKCYPPSLCITSFFVLLNRSDDCMIQSRKLEASSDSFKKEETKKPKHQPNKKQNQPQTHTKIGLPLREDKVL